jgi:hypothetical protein
MTIKTPNLPLDHPAWAEIHRCYLDAVSQQKPKLQTLLAREVGDSFDGFLQACADRLIIISSQFTSEGLVYCIAVSVSDGYAPLGYMPAARLGLDTVENEADELSWKLRDGSN